MSDRPTERAWNHRPLIALVEREPFAGVYQPDPRITVERLLIGSNDRINEASLKVWLGPTTPAAGGESEIDGLSCLNGLYRPGWGGPYITCDQLVVIARRISGEIDDSAGASLAAEFEPLFSGYCDLPEYSEQSSVQGSTNELRLTVRGCLERVSDLERSQISGRRMRKAEEQDLLDAEQSRDSTTPHGTHSDVQVVPGFPCVFNPGGIPNCAAAPVTAILAGESVSVPVFTHDNDPDAVPWTFAKILRYLVYWHLYENAIEDTGTVRDGNVFDLTEDLLALGNEDRPSSPVDYEDAWTFAALGVAANLNLDGMNVVEALIAAAEASGTRFWTPTEWDDDNQPVDRLTFWPRGAGEKAWLHRTPWATGTAREILEENDLASLAVRMDYRDVLPNLKVIGDVRRYEITTELIPGWKPDENLDNISGSEAIQTAIDYAEAHLPPTSGEDLLEDPWYNKYHKNGVSAPEYANVGRRWILNTSGRYKADDGFGNGYARTVGPFDSDAYAPWDPTRCGIKNAVLEDGTLSYRNVAAGSWVRRPRPFLPCFTADIQRTSLGIVVQVSFDGGSIWHRLPALCPVALGNDSGIQFTCEDLTLIKDPKSDCHFWEAMIRGLARVRVTAVIEGDDRLTPAGDSRVEDAASSLSRLIDVSSRFKSNDRTGGNSIFSDSEVFDGTKLSETEESRVDAEAITEHARTLLEVCTVRQQAGAPRIPWLTTDYMPGTSIVGVEGLGFEFASHSTSVQRRYPDVVGVEYVGAQTVLALDDWRVFDDYRRGGDDQ